MRSSPFGALDTLAVTAATGDRDAARHLLDIVWPILVRRCRAELDITTADSVATAVSSTALRAFPHRRPPQQPLLRVLEATTNSMIDRTGAADPASRQPGPLAALPRPQREVLILRLVVGLSVDDTATSLGRTSAEVLLDQHRALRKLREIGIPHERLPPSRR
ncbi:sigma factor-like helix-turn-helix DNA-binding protein [Rhodococcus koreensis]|uniref:sigma factor-like helix-turn-helix DNA-binding protein n=1 Tax=Rhodococcus sp. T2V TaxID=3034164 RepID=UPI0023E2E589|nr:sigma factor-like helix-turn-helix DNA-binding protein [Rhodococcus sp. T2V]MDF3311391.1 sigma factor-like helix-turn-helix DNA-binding protein [Rhodococcus sp. T2V]